MADFIQKLIDNIPDYQQFLTVDEMDENSKRLAAEFPGIVEIFEAGKSRKGHPSREVTIFVITLYINVIERTVCILFYLKSMKTDTGECRCR